MRALLAAAAVAVNLFAAATVNRPIVNMHSKPSEDTDVVSQARFGENVDVLEERGPWSYIRTADQYKGWVPEASVVRREAPYEGTSATVSLFTHLYRDKSVTQFAPVLTVPFETRLAVRDTGDERWLEATLPDGRKAWVQRGDIRLNPSPIDPAQMLALSRRFLGLPYTWGGTSSFGYDCSGFTQMLLRQRGIVMPRDAHQQEAWEGVQPVAKANLEPGDLLFFGPSPKKITHTGLYIGKGEFVHATTHEYPVVQISVLDDPYWTRLYISARRPR